jgi:hypothetical protein
MNYFTSEAYEKGLDEKYMKYVKIKQAEIDETERKTKRVQKYTARAYILHPERVFYVEDGKIFCGSLENECPTELVPGGKCYTLDGDFKNKILEFQNKNKRYKIIFSPDGKFGPTCCYCSKENATPAKLESYDGEFLIVDDDDKYDICVG